MRGHRTLPPQGIPRHASLPISQILDAGTKTNIHVAKKTSESDGGNRKRENTSYASALCVGGICSAENCVEIHFQRSDVRV